MARAFFKIVQRIKKDYLPMGKKPTVLRLALILVFTLAGREKVEEQPSMYAQAGNRTYLETGKTADGDVFFIFDSVSVCG